MIDLDGTVTVAEYLGLRLRHAGVEHLFGVPGDFNLNLLDGLAFVEGLRWVGSPNELGAGYAADAYARRRGLSALFTTYGVGELSAINAVAGSAAEDSPVVHVVGSPRTTTVAGGALVHHTIADGDFRHFARAYAEVTVAQAMVTATDAGAQIDRVLLAALTHRKPVYLSIPQDLALHRIPAAPLREPLTPASDPAAVERFRTAVRDLLTPAVRPIMLVGQLVSRYGLSTLVTDMTTRSGIPVAAQLSAKGVIDESVEGNLGLYAGSMLDGPAASLIDSADVVLHLGTALTAELTGFFTHRRPDARTVQLLSTAALVGTTRFDNVLFPDAMTTLAEVLTTFPAPARLAAPTTRAEPTGLAASITPPAPSAVDLTASTATDLTAPTAGDISEMSRVLTQDAFWAGMQAWLPAGHALVADTGTSYWGALALRLPGDTVFLGQPIWNSIGWALPAVLGQGLADPDRRPVLVIGDGAAQMTIQELSTIVAAGLRPIILLLNNRGYTIERALQSPNAGYNDVADWNWRAVVAAFAGPDTDYHHAATGTELAKALTAASESNRPVFIEVELDAFDTPPLLRRLAERATAPS
ncbi:putative indolepyruvate decarboxylase [Actinoplanes missouriensis 431]|uniref:Alpha-keto-acid decarboxylase n=1 Tax=Actinoplanes missouriensis (strain ATCC 14538 / DSM 43046 / CBS 188.64 / JCM 3121 / NBRC 102363 / NCIMB 12654 / NRRL B-3342 / UNCC 431) TaxID=512565 RepID=I0H1Q5_ACTM4|nr:thiamine pyrophosphate-binding protein [Actinoplanes missouriensis]BAL86942.1 putative indolepyruvate decarboxylase [Actinoplanes missouriensis 431]